MRAPVKKLIGYKSRNYFANEENSKTVSMPLNQKGFKVANNKRYYLTPGFRKKRACKRKNNLNGKPIETPQKKSDFNIDKRIGSFKLTGKRTCFSVGKNSKNLARSSEKKSARRRRLKGRKKIIVQDEVSRMQRRASYLLIKMKLEQTLIDAYSGDGWKGHSREKIKPEKELQRAQRQILKCKLGIRDSIHQLDLLGSEGRIEDSVMNPDGSVFHEHIFCAKCKSREAFPDNDIILCDGNCNCGFHQKCLEPPLQKSMCQFLHFLETVHCNVSFLFRMLYTITSVPPGDQGWLCKICNCKMEILETINAHLSTCFTVNSSWEDIFKEAVVGPDAEGACSNLVEDWPSDDSEDEDYSPDNNTAEFEENISDDACSSVNSIFSSDASLNFVNCLGSDESGDEITNYRRQRRDVDYRKLYDEMFGKEPNDGTEQSEDEDWGPYRKKKARIASDVGITSTDGENKDSNEKIALGDAISCNKRSIFRIPPDAIEKLRQIFDENELPSRTVKENLSKQLDISVEKVDKWFKNARYAAIKIRKEEASNQLYHRSDVPMVDEGHRRRSDTAVSLDSSCLLPLASIFHLPQHKKKIHRRENLTSAAFPAKKQKGAATTVHSSAIQARTQSRNAVWLKKHTITRDRDLTPKKITAIVPEADKTYINEMQMLWVLERRLHQLKQQLLACKDYNEVQAKKLSGEEAVIYVPVAEVKEKVS
ncbi:pathogenesis-related homeodomain protein [Dendrobium catenatum]|uniref:pathogenesis-related homeodomain protein n=1 Tax=Dendrobium catenatum TaxID=906689 RepID=UPI0010A09DA5|nr:pathogenesis-related homeodomain protein [Dendrobium catenatum]